LEEKKKTLITPEKRSLNLVSKGLRDFRRLREQLAKQLAPSPEQHARSQQEPEITR
jgi:hypothetical protein